MKNRKYPRLKYYDYRRAGAYFVTLVCHQRAPLFGHIDSGQMLPTALGELVGREWQELPRRHASRLKIDAYILMPNHLHGILWLEEAGARSLCDIISLFKAGVTRQAQIKIWQRSFYDRVVRNEQDLLQFRQYIQQNPLRWELDRFHICQDYRCA